MRETRCRRAARSLALLLGGVNAAACMQFRPPPPPVPPEAACTCDTVWTAGVGRSATGSLALIDRRVVLAGTDRTIHVVSLDSGTVSWSRRLSGSLLAGVTVRDDVIYASTERPEAETVALELAGGKELWRQRVGRSGVAMAVSSALAIVQVRSGEVVALHRGTGIRAWRREVAAGLTPPALTAGGAVLATGLDSLYLLEPDSGTTRRVVPTPGQAPGGWLMLGEVAVAGLASGGAVAVDTADLSVRWRHPLDGPVLVPPRAVGDTLLMVTQLGTIWVVPVDGGTPTVRHRANRPLGATPVPFRGSLLVAGADGTVRALAPDGRERWQVNHWQPVRVPPLPDGEGGLLVIGANGDLVRYAFP